MQWQIQRAGAGLKKLFSGLRASVWSKNKCVEGVASAGSATGMLQELM